MNRFQQLICAAALGFVFAPSQAHADPPGPGKTKGEARAEKADKKDKKEARGEPKAERKDARDERKDERKEARDERKDERKDARDERKDARDERKADRKEAHEGHDHHEHGDDDDDRPGLKLGHDKDKARGHHHFKPSPEFVEQMKKLHESRKERRKERRDKYKKKWGDFASERPALNEFRLHGWRMAKLQRIRRLAEEMDKEKLVAKVDELIKKEEARHEKALERLKESGGKADKDPKAPKEAKGDAKGPKPDKLDKAGPKPKKLEAPKPAKAAKEGE